MVGVGVRIFNFVNAYGCSIGDNSKVGAFVEIQKGATIGKSCKISSHTFICEGVTIEDEVFIGHNVTFVNDTFPRATTTNGALQTEADWKVESTIVKRGASIGSGATILANVVIGEYALIGAGAVRIFSASWGSVVSRSVARFSRLSISLRDRASGTRHARGAGATSAEGAGSGRGRGWSSRCMVFQVAL